MDFFKKILLGLITVLIAGSLLIATNFLLFDNRAGAQNIPVKNPSAGSNAAQATTAITIQVKDIKDTGHLRLVNARYETKAEKTANLVKSSDGLHRYHKDIKSALAGFFEYCAKNQNALYISSAYRTIQDQAAIYESTKDKSLVQTPGHSEHHTGLAVDLQPAKALEGVFGDALNREKEFMEKNAWRFGFIQRYPEGKQSVTGIAFEYWHFRYVGRPHAEYMYEHDLVLEEYLDLIRYKGQLEIESEDGKYTVYWRMPDDGKIRFLPGGAYDISSTNRGAYLITVKAGD